MRNRYFIWLVVFMLFLSSLYAVWAKKYDIYDYIVLRNYTPPALIAQLAADDTMTKKSRNIFYVNKPQVSDRNAFKQQCLSNSKPEQTIVLGCYNGLRIYVFKVDDPQLNGVEQVTAAHEMLHAAYDRLSSSEREHIDELVMAQYKKINDPRINELAASYEKQEPGSVPNELHSILGTEIKNVGPELEAYYSRYFSNRQKVVSYAIAYQQKFEDLKTQVAKYDADLVLRKAEIDNLNKSLELQLSDLQSQKSQMDRLLANGQTRSYNAQVGSYNQKVSDYNASLEKVKSLISEYNKIVEARNQLAVEQQNLAQSLDSRLNPISNQ